MGTSCDGGGRLPEDAAEVEVYLRNVPAGLGADTGEVQACAESFFNELEAVGWVNSKGVPVRNWRAMARSYLGKWLRNCHTGHRSAARVKVRSEQKRNYGL